MQAPGIQKPGELSAKMLVMPVGLFGNVQLYIDDFIVAHLVGVFGTRKWPSREGRAFARAPQNSYFPITSLAKRRNSRPHVDRKAYRSSRWVYI